MPSTTCACALIAILILAANPAIDLEHFVAFIFEEKLSFLEWQPSLTGCPVVGITRALN
jgi:hypothetical protein